ncbi:MAG: STAS domain-containing protein [Bryobacteraceae bacterium]
MSLRIEERDVQGIAILDLEGPLTLGDAEVALRDKLSALHQAGTVNIALNFKHVTHLDSAALGMLVYGMAKLRKAGGNLALFNVNESHLELLLLTKLALAFAPLQDEQDAVNSFFPDRAVKHFDVLAFVQEEETSNGPAD